MDFNKEFMDDVQKAKESAMQLGFENEKQWAIEASRAGIITRTECNNFISLHMLRVLCAHGHSRDIAITQETRDETRRFVKRIRASGFRARAYDDFAYGYRRNDGFLDYDEYSYMLPEGSFGGRRSEPGRSRKRATRSAKVPNSGKKGLRS